MRFTIIIILFFSNVVKAQQTRIIPQTDLFKFVVKADTSIYSLGVDFKFEPNAKSSIYKLNPSTLEFTSTNVTLQGESVDFQLHDSNFIGITTVYDSLLFTTMDKHLDKIDSFKIRNPIKYHYWEDFRIVHDSSATVIAYREWDDLFLTYVDRESGSIDSTVFISDSIVNEPNLILLSDKSLLLLVDKDDRSGDPLKGFYILKERSIQRELFSWRDSQDGIGENGTREVGVLQDSIITFNTADGFEGFSSSENLLAINLKGDTIWYNREAGTRQVAPLVLFGGLTDRNIGYSKVIGERIFHFGQTDYILMRRPYIACYDLKGNFLWDQEYRFFDENYSFINSGQYPDKFSNSINHMELINDTTLLVGGNKLDEWYDTPVGSYQSTCLWTLDVRTGCPSKACGSTYFFDDIHDNVDTSYRWTYLEKNGSDVDTVHYQFNPITIYADFEQGKYVGWHDINHKYYLQSDKDIDGFANTGHILEGPEYLRHVTIDDDGEEGAEPIRRYDYNLLLGQSLSEEADLQGEAYLESIDKILLGDGKKHKKLSIKSSDGLYDDVWIDGIGSTKAMLNARHERYHQHPSGCLLNMSIQDHTVYENTKCRKYETLGRIDAEWKYFCGTTKDTLVAYLSELVFDADLLINYQYYITKNGTALDTLAKVYERYGDLYTESDGKWLKIYDFSFEIGDLVDTDHEVVSIDTIQFMDGLTRRRMYIMEAFANDTITWIEGVGSLSMLHDALSSKKNLLSYSQSGTVLYENKEADLLENCIVTNTKTPIKEDFKIYPNPVSKMLNLSRVVDYTILDINMNQISNGRGREIDLETLLSGVYFIKVGNSIQRFIKI